MEGCSPQVMVASGAGHGGRSPAPGGWTRRARQVLLGGAVQGGAPLCGRVATPVAT